MKLKYSNIFLYALSIFLLFEGLDAFSIYNIPIYWLGVSFLSTIYLICYFLGFRTFNLNLISIRNWVIYGVFVTLIQSFFNDLILPKYASTSYIQYIGLRLFKLFLFLIVIYLINYILQKYDFEKILKFLLISSIAISTLSIISYFSYIYGYSDFPRTRPGSGGWTQPIQRACNILRNYGTFREPSFLAIWTVPFIPYFFYLGKKSKIWYILSLIPILSVVLSRSLTGIIAFVASIVIVTVLLYLTHKKLELNIILMLSIFLIVIFSSGIFSYQFPPDENTCIDVSSECVCTPEDRLDELKNSPSFSEATFGRFGEISSQGLDAFGNTAFLFDYIENIGFSIFGQGYGYSNIAFSYAADEAGKQLVDNQIIYRNPGQVVSFNNLYANILMSTGLVGLLWFLYILINVLRKIVFMPTPLQPYLLISFISTLFVYSYQAEELATHLAIAIAFGINLKNYEK